MVRHPFAAVPEAEIAQEIVDARNTKSEDLGYEVCGRYIELGMDGRRRVCWFRQNHSGPHGQ
jgi:hypothetical protein